ncbi:CAP domain-containing protein [Salinispora arenicola]|uniref:CAP domain-containing protein n=1 Tax=Salinispora arenicola TaxID=168697 RepID=UPI00039E3232|nr:CAP domain-containing protein [Salinispora arenicola]
MYGWSESMEPDDNRRRSEPTADGWDRPADGWDGPTDGWDRPADGWDRRQQNAHWRAESETPQGWGTAGGSYHDQPSRSGESVPTGQQRGSTDGWQQELSGGWRRRQPTDWRNESSGGWRHAAGATGGPEVTGGWRPDETTARPTSGHADDLTSTRPIAGAAPADATPAGKGHRAGHRNRRPVLIGAAAAATLVVSLGVGTAALSDGGDTIPTSAHKDMAATSPTSYERGMTSSSTNTAWGTGSRSRSDSAHRKSASKASRHSAKSRSDQERKRARHRPKPAHTTSAPSPTQVPTTAPSPTQVPTTAPSPTQVPTTAPSPTQVPTTVPPNGDVSTEASEVVRLVNAERAKAGCEALSINEKLMTAAQQHSQDQADHQKMSHTGSNGSSPGDRINAVGYEWRAYGENVAWNQQSPEAVMDAWMNSSGHRANILNCSFTEIGVGVASSNGPYWTQVFAAPR